MTALVHMGDEDLKALGVPMVNLQTTCPALILHFCLRFLY